MYPLLLSIPSGAKTSFKLVTHFYCTDSSSIRKRLILSISRSLGVELRVVLEKNSARVTPNLNIFDLHGSAMGSAADMDSRP